MVSSRPYLIRAMHEWILDSDLTPYVLVDANYKDVVIPLEYVEDGKILLNISSGATQNLNLGNEFVIFSARFSGKSMEVSFPVDAALAVYAKENGRGMMFNTDGTDDDPPSSEPSPTDPSMSGSSAPGSTPAPAKKPSLKIVK